MSVPIEIIVTLSATVPVNTSDADTWPNILDELKSVFAPIDESVDGTGAKYVTLSVVSKSKLNP